MLLSRHQNTERNSETKIANRSFEIVAQFRYLETTVSNKNLIQEEIKRRVNSGNAFSPETFVFSSAVYKHKN
jgi:hypothetical protein